MQFMPLLAISPRFFTPLFSRYHNALLEFDGAARVLIPYQHFTFIPLLMVAKFGKKPIIVAIGTVISCHSQHEAWHE